MTAYRPPAGLINPVGVLGREFPLAVTPSLLLVLGVDSPERAALDVVVVVTLRDSGILDGTPSSLKTIKYILNS